MPITPSKFIKCKVLSNGTISNNVTTGFYQQTGVVLQITPTIIGTKTFDYRDIKNGDYITSNSQAKCMQISNIVVTDAANGKISCTLTDEDNFNKLNDLSGEASPGITLQSTRNTFIFSVDNLGVPSVVNIPDGTAISSTFDPSFTASLIARFAYKNILNKILNIDVDGNFVLDLNSTF